ncbi:MAG: GatB/YqeY domain-containing protein [Proteobacteria bacterium]|nr:GatB/YqeY domain-containing protein [Pseudomonadota bacterium]
MSIKSTLIELQTQSLKSGDKETLRVVRMALAEIKQIEVDTREELTEAKQLSLIEKMVKQRNESVKAFQEGGREDLASIEISEIKFLEQFLPEKLSPEETDKMIADAIAELDAKVMADMGKVMAHLKDKAAGQVDMGYVSQKVKESLS